MRTISIGLSLPLSGVYAAIGLQIEAALRLFASDANAAGGVEVAGERCALELEYRDDGSRRDRAREIYRWLAFERRVDVLGGPYSTALTRVAAAVADEAGMLLVNHGGAGDDLYPNALASDRISDRPRMIVGILSPASTYLNGVIRLIATLKFWRKRVAIVAAKTPFARAVALGAERQCNLRRNWLHGVRLRLKFSTRFDPEQTPEVLLAAIRRNRINAILSAGNYAHDLAIMALCAASAANIPVLGCVAAGVARFGRDLGMDADGIVGPSQWEPDFAIVPELGPTPGEFARRMEALGAPECDYPAAQAYAAGLLTVAALRNAGATVSAPASRQGGALDQGRLRAAFADLHTTTLFGDFAVDPLSGRQIGHQMLLVQWHRGRKVLIDAEPDPDAGAIEFPSGWRLVLASLHYFRLSGRARGAGEEAPPAETLPKETPDEIDDDEKG
ncbi:MAG: branched-chain amino acid transport system substrate-binding protein [Candidatus Binataceae bacterium]|nr:branched-chain amino acid transport system substrate-binding protein [Candidatus Binataceae bacterium]